MRTRLTLVLVLLLAFCFCVNAVSKKPTVVILPSNNWCSQRYFMTKYANQGATVSIPNYEQAFREDIELPQVISKIGELLTAKGYSLKDVEQGIKSLQIKIAEDNVTTSKTSGASLVESPLDMLKRRIKSDVIIQIDWTVNTTSKGHSVSFTLEAFDAYTNKRIATSTGVCKASKKAIPLQLEQAIQEHIAPFDQQMNNWFADQQMNGREILLTIRCWDSWDQDLETEYGGEELADCIREWMDEHTVKSVYNMSDATESFMQFEQVRIPIMNEKGVAQDARDFAMALRKYLQKAPFGITSKVIVRGLAEAIIVLGEK